MEVYKLAEAYIDYINIFEIEIANPHAFYVNEGKDPFDLTRGDIEFALKHKFNLGERIWERERSKLF